jgi:hypothetical protein
MNIEKELKGLGLSGVSYYDLTHAVGKGVTRVKMLKWVDREIAYLKATMPMNFTEEAKILLAIRDLIKNRPRVSHGFVNRCVISMWQSDDQMTLRTKIISMLREASVEVSDGE